LALNCALPKKFLLHPYWHVAIRAIMHFWTLNIMHSWTLTLWEPGYDIFVLWFQPQTAVFGCLTNALAPPSIALESCSRAQLDRPA